MSGSFAAPRNGGLVADGVEFDWAALSSRVAETAAWLSAIDARVVVWQLDNGADWIVLDLACLAARVVAVPVPSYFTPGQLDHVIRDSAADVVLLARAQPLEALAGAAIVTGVPGLIARHWTCRRAAPSSPGLEGIAKITYTSGTTGRPKGVCLAQGSLDAVAASLLSVTDALELESHLCVLPLPTLLENLAGVQAPLVGGMQVVAPPLAEVGLEGSARFDAGRLLDALHRYRPNSIILLPQMLLALLHAIERGRAVPAELRFIAVGGARVPAELCQRAHRLGLPVYEGYGLSECCSVVALSHPGANRPGSVGRPLPHAQVRIADDGEILVRGASMQGYLRETRCDDLEIATGDLGHFDADGFLYVHGRKKNVFITSFGRNVSPEWVEAELTATGTLVQAVVCGEARPWNVAMLVAAPGVDRNGAAVRRAVDRANDALPDYARIGRWILAEEPWTAANGLATANGRPRRDAILAAHATRIEALYANTADGESKDGPASAIS